MTMRSVCEFYPYIHAQYCTVHTVIISKRCAMLCMVLYIYNRFRVVGNIFLEKLHSAQWHLAQYHQTLCVCERERENESNAWVGVRHSRLLEKRAHCYIRFDSIDVHIPEREPSPIFQHPISRRPASRLAFACRQRAELRAAEPSINECFN